MSRRPLLLSVLAGGAILGAVSAAFAAAAPPHEMTPAPTTTAPKTTTAPATTVAPTGTAPTTPAAAAAAALASGSAASTLVLSGHGWGHGVGMSQWGAYGYAQHGWSYRQILAHYYPGTTIESRPSIPVRVLLVESQPKIALESLSPWRLVDGSGAKVALPAGRLAVPATLVVAGKKRVPPLTFKPGQTPLVVGGKPYRGTVAIARVGRKLQAVNTLPLEPYVDAVVGSEVPSSWPPAALEAQAVAARSFTLASLGPATAARAFDVYSDTRSQVYGGIVSETPAANTAVSATAHQAVVYGGNVAQTLFSASSGGETVSAAEVTGSPVPYLRSVPDPYDALSPYHDWGPVAIDAAAAAKALHLAGPLIDLMPTPGPSGHNATVTAVGPTTRTTLTGTDVRLALGLRSTWFQVGWLTLVPPPAPVVYGRQGTLDGIARGLAGVTLEAKTPTGAWQRVAAVAPDPSGVFSVAVSPREPTSYRLAVGTSRASPVQVAVAPLVRAAIRGGAFTGTVSPALAGASVQLQRLDGTAWKSVAPVAVDPAGGFRIRAEPAAGTYRVRYAPGAGFAPGFSPDVLVSP